MQLQQCSSLNAIKVQQSDAYLLQGLQHVIEVQKSTLSAEAPAPLLLLVELLLPCAAFAAGIVS
jgi:hypothetical protein